jgi:hypothetical protein
MAGATHSSWEAWGSAGSGYRRSTPPAACRIFAVCRILRAFTVRRAWDGLWASSAKVRWGCKTPTRLSASEGAAPRRGLEPPSRWHGRSSRRVVGPLHRPTSYSPAGSRLRAMGDDTEQGGPAGRDHDRVGTVQLFVKTGSIRTTVRLSTA